jgi:hypothetical protein
MAKQNPLDPRLIESACALHARLDFWRLADDALTAAASAFPGFSRVKTLAKVVLVKSLYFTSVFAVIRVADHFAGLLEGTAPKVWTIGLIERLPPVRLDAKSSKTRRLISLASKFAHFFLKSCRFPIYDDYAMKMLASHTGRTQNNLKASFSEYCTAFIDLARRVGVETSPRELDRYLWIQG